MPSKKTAATHRQKSAPARPSAAGRKTARRSTPRTAPRRHGPVIRLPRWLIGGSTRGRPLLSAISPERKLDLLGTALALTGLLTLLSLLSATRGSLTGLWVGWLTGLLGWAVYALPVALVAVGLWLVFRNIERLPQVAIERLVGLVLLYLNLLPFLSLLAAPGQPGGGTAGRWISAGLVSAFGLAGCAVILAAWLLASLTLLLDISIPELFRWTRPLLDRIRQAWAEFRFPREEANPAAPLSHEALPPNFTPLQRVPADATGVPGGAVPAPVVNDLNGAAGPHAPWILPEPAAILEAGIPAGSNGAADEARGRVIEETLRSFGAPAHIVEVHRGPTITQFGVEPDFVESRSGRTRVRVSKIVALADDLALALAAQRIRIQAPVPGRAYVGIEVPNDEISRVALRDVVESEPFQKLRSPLRFALGKDVAGKPVAASLDAMPHLLIAGTTGSGKSVCVNSILSCFLINNTPDSLRLILVDPKRVELTGYNGIPHLLAPVVVDAERVVGALQWMLREMDGRYQKFAALGARNIVDYNTRCAARAEKQIPYIVVVIDELADLMMLAPDETERTITRLAQLARATGIHLIIATQRPSVDVITGLIKANFPARVAFAVASGVDSRVILDQPGAERLLGRGDMLFQAPDAPAPARLQGVFVSDTEIQRLVAYWHEFSAAPSTASDGGPTDAVPTGVPLKQMPLWDEMVPQSDEDPLLKDAIELVRREGRASISMLQRRMRVGYTRAARMVDSLEAKGIIGPALANSQVRQVLDYGPLAPPVDEG